MNGWIKHLNDNTTYKGHDHLVFRKKASWSKSECYLKKVELLHDGLCVIINGKGEYWQSDDFEQDIFKKKSRIVKRRIEYLLKENRYLEIDENENRAIYSFFSEKKDSRIDLNDFVNCWFVAEINLKTKKLSYRIVENKI